MQYTVSQNNPSFSSAKDMKKFGTGPLINEEIIIT